jgi:hypothetical protein
VPAPALPPLVKWFGAPAAARPTAPAAPADGPDAAAEPAPADGPDAAVEPAPADSPDAAGTPAPADRPDAAVEPAPAGSPDAAAPPDLADEPDLGFPDEVALTDALRSVDELRGAPYELRGPRRPVDTTAVLTASHPAPAGPGHQVDRWHLLDPTGRLTVVSRPWPPPARPRRKPSGNPVAGLLWLVVLGLVAAFFGWFSAEPLWLSLGHGVPGTATVGSCSVHGIGQRCADFTSAGGSFTATRVTLLGSGQVGTGQQVAARMVSARGWEAYAGGPRGLYLRWIPGLVIVVLCGLGIAWGTGAARLPRRHRWLALLASVAGTVLLAAGLFVAAW